MYQMAVECGNCLIYSLIFELFHGLDVSEPWALSRQPIAIRKPGREPWPKPYECHELLVPWERGKGVGSRLPNRCGGRLPSVADAALGSRLPTRCGGCLPSVADAPTQCEGCLIPEPSRFWSTQNCFLNSFYIQKPVSFSHTFFAC